MASGLLILKTPGALMLLLVSYVKESIWFWNTGKCTGHSHRMYGERSSDGLHGKDNSADRMTTSSPHDKFCMQSACGFNALKNVNHVAW